MSLPNQLSNIASLFVTTVEMEAWAPVGIWPGRRLMASFSQALVFLSPLESVPLAVAMNELSTKGDVNGYHEAVVNGAATSSPSGRATGPSTCTIRHSRVWTIVGWTTPCVYKTSPSALHIAKIDASVSIPYALTRVQPSTVLRPMALCIGHVSRLEKLPPQTDAVQLC